MGRKISWKLVHSELSKKDIIHISNEVRTSSRESIVKNVQVMCVRNLFKVISLWRRTKFRKINKSLN